MNHAVARWIGLWRSAFVGNPIGGANLRDVGVGQVHYLCWGGFSAIQLLFYANTIIRPNRHRRATVSCRVFG